MTPRRSPLRCPSLLPPDLRRLRVGHYLAMLVSAVGLYRDVEELLAERGIEVDHVTVYRWVQRCTPLLAEAATRTGTGSVTAGGSVAATYRQRGWC